MNRMVNKDNNRIINKITKATKVMIIIRNNKVKKIKEDSKKTKKKVKPNKKKDSKMNKKENKNNKEKKMAKWLTKVKTKNKMFNNQKMFKMWRLTKKMMYNNLTKLMNKSQHLKILLQINKIKTKINKKHL